MIDYLKSRTLAFDSGFHEAAGTLVSLLTMSLRSRPIFRCAWLFGLVTGKFWKHHRADYHI
jgi:hypothetical protein